MPLSAALAWLLAPAAISPARNIGARRMYFAISSSSAARPRRITQYTDRYSMIFRDFKLISGHTLAHGTTPGLTDYPGIIPLG